LHAQQLAIAGIRCIVEKPSDQAEPQSADEAGAENLSDIRIAWPAPPREERNSAGHPFVFPLRCETFSGLRLAFPLLTFLVVLTSKGWIMLHSAKELLGLSVAETDGELGTIDDLYFDDAQWTVRYLVVDTGGWMTGRDVLIPIHALQSVDWAEETLRVGLTRQQIKDSPGIDAAKPVSRQHETDLYNHYGYPYYWTGPYLWGATSFPTIVHAEPFGDMNRPQEVARVEQEREHQDPHLRSAKEVIGYAIEATDDNVGHIEDLMIDDKEWSVRLIAVDTDHWWPDKSVLLSPQRIRGISWSDSRVKVDLNRSEVENSEEYDPANPPPLGPKYDLYRRFGMPHS
jgi:uncharacterized protein YrrD